MKKSKNNTVDKRKECFSCYGSHTGVCKNTNTIVKDTSCPFYVSIFDKGDNDGKA